MPNLDVPPLEHARQVARSLGSGTSTFVPYPVNASTEAPATAMYRRICSTVTNGPSSQVATPVSPTPWDMIELLSRQNAEYTYQVVPRPNIVSSSDDEERTHDADQGDQNDLTPILSQQTQPKSSSSSFCLSEALEDMKLLDSAEGSELVRPLEELRSMLVNAEVPIRERLEILKNLQLRDNWLGFLAKHFRRALNKMNSEEDISAQKVRRLQEIFAELAPSPSRQPKGRSSPGSLSSGLPPRPPSSSKSSPQLSQKPSPTLIPNTIPTSHCSGHTLKVSPPASMLPTVQEGPEHNSGQIPPSVKSSATPPVERRSPKAPGEKIAPSLIIPELAPKRGWDSNPMIALVPPANRSSIFSEECAVWQVADVLMPPMSKEEKRFCTCLLADQLGASPLTTSGLTHFSRSCEGRARKNF